MPCRDIVVVGGSAGSGLVLNRLIPALPKDFPASLFVVAHSGPSGFTHLVEQLHHRSALPVTVATDGQPIETGHIYFPPANHHLLIWRGVIRLGAGPLENMTRPAIDPLFHSAALAFGGRVIGVILSGYLNDGASGLYEIKRRGGFAVVQQPLDAEVTQMPQAALEAVSVDRIVRAEDMAPLLSGLVREPAEPDLPVPPGLELEVRIALGARSGSAVNRELGPPSALSCPHCQGVLNEVSGPGPLRYRCQTGHAYTAEAVQAAQQETVEEAMMLALRVMEERVTLVERMAAEARVQGRIAAAEIYENRVAEYARYAETLRTAATRSLTPDPDLAAE